MEEIISVGSQALFLKDNSASEGSHRVLSLALEMKKNPLSLEKVKENPSPLCHMDISLLKNNKHVAAIFLY